MAGLILGHLMDCVMNGVIAELLRPCGDSELAFASAGLSLITFLEIGLGVPNNLTKKLGEL